MSVGLRSAVVLGATGLVGGKVVAQLVADPACESVVTLGRRGVGLRAPKLRDVVCDLASPSTYGEYLAVDCVVCALGTTIKQAGSKESFRRVDYEYPLAVAREALARGARRYVLVSSVGADTKSPSFYLRVKGELEAALGALPFTRGVRVVHPSLLLGDREVARPGEQAAAALFRLTAPMFMGPLAKYRAIAADDVARALVTAARSDGAGVAVYEGESLFRAAQQPH